MKVLRGALMGIASLVICCVWAAHGDAQIGGSTQTAAKCKETVVVGPPTIVRTPGPAEQKVLAALKEPVDFEFTETPLNEVLTYIKDNHELQIFVDNKVLSDAGIDTTTLPITTNLKGVSLRSALKMILQSQGLAYYFADEILKITTKEDAEGIFETRLYDVRDLTSSDRDPQAPPDFDSLIKTIVATVKGNWQAAGGLATIHSFSNGGIRAISVAQTYDGHEQIEALLAELRKLKPQR